MADADPLRLRRSSSGGPHQLAAPRRLGLVLPKELGSDALLTIVAVFGTTISPYLFFWQSSQEAEEIAASPASKVDPAIAAQRSTAVPAHAFRHADRDGLLQPHRARHHAGDRCDVAFARSDADQLGSSGGGRASTRCRRVRFRPVRGRNHRHRLSGRARCSPVRLRSRSPRFLDGRKGSSASRGRRRVSIRSSSSRRWSALLIDWSPVDPIRALFWSAVLNGVTAVPLMIAMMIVVSRHAVMGRFTANRTLLLFGWGATAVMALASGAMLVDSDWPGDRLTGSHARGGGRRRHRASAHLRRHRSRATVR